MFLVDKLLLSVQIKLVFSWWILTPENNLYQDYSMIGSSNKLSSSALDIRVYFPFLILGI